MYPKFKYYSSKSNSSECYTYLNTRRNNSKYKTGLGFGGNESIEKMRIWIDNNLEFGSCTNPEDQTFEKVGNPSLAGETMH